MSRGLLVILSVGGVLAALPASGKAQGLTVEAGGIHAEYADSVSGTAARLGLRLDVASRRAYAVIDAGLSSFTTGETVYQAVGRGSVFAISNQRLALGLQWNGEWDQLGNDSGVGAGSVGPLLGIGGHTFTATARATVGGVRNLDGISEALGSAGLGVDVQVTQAASVQFAAALTMSDTLRYTDFSAGLQLRHRNLSAWLYAGSRAGDLADDPWGQLRMQVLLVPWAAVEGAVGRYPRDLLGFSDGIFATLGFRVALVGNVRSPGTSKVLPITRPPILVEGVGNGRSRVTVYYQGGVMVGLAIAGDWNGWQAVPLNRVDRDTWSTELLLPPGLRRFQLIVDGETWIVPEGVPWIQDEFGGRAGLMVVKGAGSRE